MKKLISGMGRHATRVVILLAVALIAVQLSYGNIVVKILENGKTTTAVSFYTNMVKYKPIQRGIFAAQADKYMKKLHADYQSGKKDFSEVQTAYQNLLQIGNTDTQRETQRYLSSLELYHAGKTALEQEEATLENTLTALTYLAQVEDGAPDSKAARKLISGAETQVQQLLAAKQELLDKTSFDAMAELLQQYENAGQFFPQSKVLEKQTRDLLTEVEDLAVSTAAERLGSFRYYEAEAVISRALAIYPDSPVLRETQASMEENRPTHLSELKTQKNSFAWMVESKQDAWGNAMGDQYYYANTNQGYILLPLDKAYRHMYGILSLQWYSSASHDYYGVRIFSSEDMAEDQLLYDSGYVSTKNGPIVLDLDISEQDTLYFYIYNVPYLMGTGQLLLSDLEFYE